MTFDFDPSLEKEVGRKAHALVKDRCLHIDADFHSYFVTYADDPDIPLNKCVDDLILQCDTLRELAGADSMYLHFTHPESVKSGRYDIAIQQPYQEKRGDAPRPRLLNDVRLEVARRYKMHKDKYGTIRASISKRFEADDTLRFACEGREDVVLQSGDKDLKFTQCLHLTDTYELKDYSNFGEAYVTTSESKSKNKKLDGYGTKFFFSQLLLGDSADNIAGCAGLARELVNQYIPSKAYLDGVSRDSADKKQTKVTQAALDDTSPKPLGLESVVKIMNTVDNNYDALKLVTQCYKQYYGSAWYSDYRGKYYTWYEVMMSEANLLWIKRDELDTAEKFFEEVIHDDY